jgi:hypothetical protein
MTNNIWEQLGQIKKDLDSIDMQLAMNNEAIESIEMELRFLQTELDYEARGNSSAG